MQRINFPDEVLTLPEGSGVYQFRDAKNTILYIGKAKNLKNRVKSYTALNLLPKTARMVQDAKTLTFIPVESEFEALLLEAKLVRLHMPLYNIELKDDKSPLYIGVTKEEYPRILTLRQTQLDQMPYKKIFGPYVDGRSAKHVLRSLRRVFPYSTHRLGKRACIYHEIGLCNPCPSAINKLTEDDEKETLRKKYLSNIAKLARVLDGNARKIERELLSQMLKFAQQDQFEEAQDIKVKISRLRRVLGAAPLKEDYLADPNFLQDIHKKEHEQLLQILRKFISVPALNRIECYDIAHLAGTNPTASMVTFTSGEPDKKYYRHFKINKGKAQNSDVDSMAEVLTRRVKHFADWGTPDLIIIDGGKPQLSAAAQILEGVVPFVGLAKRYETLVFLKDGQFREFLLPESGAKNLVVRLRNEAHRFARRLHHNLVTKTLLGEL